MFTITNFGTHILNTDYFSSHNGLLGHMFLSWYAGNARLLIPALPFDELWPEIHNACHVIITSGKSKELGDVEAVEIMFLYTYDAPFVITLPIEQCDCIFDSSITECFDVEFSVYSEHGFQGRLQAIYRKQQWLTGMKPTFH